jgi:hypothetical protein
MTTPDDISHAEHLRQGQDHYRWRQEHMEALALLKRAEAAIFAHEARILAHEAEIARHEEQIAHGDAHADPLPPDEHARFTQAHDAGSAHHARLLDAIRALATPLEDVP